MKRILSAYLGHHPSRQVRGGFDHAGDGAASEDIDPVQTRAPWPPQNIPSQRANPEKAAQSSLWPRAALAV